jgi:hypothetical protein
MFGFFYLLMESVLLMLIYNEGRLFCSKNSLYLILAHWLLAEGCLDAANSWLELIAHTPRPQTCQNMEFPIGEPLENLGGLRLHVSTIFAMGFGSPSRRSGGARWLVVG